MKQSDAKKLAEECGFTNCGIFDVKEMKFMTEVRDMCRANLCGLYGKCWTCPPAIDELEEIAAKAREYKWGILLQTTAYMEDEFDGETMMEAQNAQKERFVRYYKQLRENQIEHLAMSSGGCNKCKKCTYPDAPCRYPEFAVPSMEAYGLLVTDVCNSANIPYYYGKNTITFSSCVLFK